MTFPTLRSSKLSVETSDVTTHDITLPATIENGDLLLVVSAQDGNSWASFPGGWTELLNVDHGLLGFAVYAKVADGTEDASVIQPTTGPLQQSSHIAIAVQAWGGSINDVEGTFNTGTSTTPDPPSHTASSGGTADRMWIAIGGADEGNNSAFSAYPYADNNLTQGSANDTGVAVALCSDELTGVTQNPGTFTIGQSQLWGAGTISIEPAGPGKPYYYYAQQ